MAKKSLTLYEALVRGPLRSVLEVAEAAEGTEAVVTFVRPVRDAPPLSMGSVVSTGLGQQTKPVASPKIMSGLGNKTKPFSRYADGRHRKDIKAEDLLVKLLTEKGRPMKTFEFITPFINHGFAGGSVHASLSLSRRAGVVRKIGRGEWALVGVTKVHMGAGEGAPVGSGETS